MQALRMFFLLSVSLMLHTSLWSQRATISSEQTALTTYPFSDPDPVPILVSNPKIYPYFKYEGYTPGGQDQDWNVVHLENDYLDVWVLPEVGGKVWGAREKSTGEEFIYRNEVMKFRNIAMRGPWTSGGIEFNFGIIGHHPSTATPVDYKIVQEEDGSVSCWVGNMDLASRTQWRVKINLPKDKAYFETRALWYNPTALHQSYYNWMTGAAFATDDLEFYCPGDQYLEHGGDPHPWPTEYGRHIAEYKENDFLSHKSYHVVGEYNDFFGGYYHDQGYGFGHWSPYDEMPGQKLWLWSLARNGGIWEDLLTDTDGQYIEFQAGRLFNQYSPGSDGNPVTQAVFPPHSTDQWQERWFPVKAIGGLTDVSPSAVLHIEPVDGKMQIGINALEQAAGTLRVFAGDRKVLEKEIALPPMGIFRESIDWPTSEQGFRVTVDGMGLDYDSDPQKLKLKRPFQKPALPDTPPSELHYRAGMEWMDFREYDKAKKSLKACLEDNPAHLEALAALAELYYRQGLYDRGLEPALRALSIDTYHPGANYVAGILFQAQGDFINAKEALGWAARSMEYRSAAYGIMAGILLAEQQAGEAIRYARQALDFNRFNMQARQTLAVAQRTSGQEKAAQETVMTLLEMDPLSHFSYFEQYLLDGQASSKQRFTGNIRNELPEQTYLELALQYHQLGQKEAALSVLELAPSSVLVNIWQAFLQDDPQALAAVANQSPELVFPFRRESLEALEWARTNHQDWKFAYYLALNYWGKGRTEKAVELLENLGNTPDYPFFYLTRANVRESTSADKAREDLLRARELQSDSWRTWHELIQFYFRQGKFAEALSVSTDAYDQFPDNYTLGMDHVRALLENQQYEPALTILQTLEVLPFEGASASRRLYEWAHLGRALEQLAAKQYPSAIRTLESYKKWPERLGVGKPYNPDERLADHLLAYAYDQTGKPAAAREARNRLLEYTRQFPLRNSLETVLGFQLMSEKELSDLAINQYDSPKTGTAIRWALAKAMHNETEADKIQQQNAGLFTSPFYQMLEKAIALGAVD
ncbi:DUF5107 domain-containing protein [Flavilitoribacter nigricans]|nr:DUF5107 domain-containing protein [Flavilitoribacter nigricans]